jgi:acetylornithine/succinyldiaminopimelate/putrescine aminotransferase
MARPGLLLLAILIALLPGLALAQKDRRPARLARPVLGQMPAGSALPWGRPPDPDHPLRKQVGAEALLRAVASLAAGNQLATLPRYQRKALSKLARAPERSLRKPKVQARLLAALEQRLGKDQYETVLGQQAVGVKKALEGLELVPRARASWANDDLHDMMRGWGTRLLPLNDKAFNDPRYQANRLLESGQSAVGMNQDEPTRALSLFHDAWRKIAPGNTRPIAFTITGSAANNLLYDMARKLKGPQAEILAFDGVYAGATGRMKELSFLGGQRKDLLITSPHSFYFKPTDKAEIQRLEALESRALAQIEEKVRANDPPVGGILVEPILGARGVLFYRPEFMLKLRELCDRLRVPIFADEILTGGGRTGKFFAYQHYEGFEPDYVTFGKGLQVAGVASVYRGSRGFKLSSALEGETTLTNYSEPLLKGAQIMNRIREDRLMENAEKVGALIVKKLARHDRLYSDDSPERHGFSGPTRGLGLLIGTSNRVKGVSTARNRLMPYLSLSADEARRIFADKNIW